ncbi:MAG: hypothetical protein ACI32F_04225 [Allobaculum sp.]
MITNKETIKLFQLGNAIRAIRFRMMQSLRYTLAGKYERAIESLNENYEELDMLRDEFSTLLAEGHEKQCQDVESSFAFSELVHDSILQANLMQSRNCSAVKFHIYN